MTDKFIEQWSNGRGNEKNDTQIFWLGLLREIPGINEPETFIEFEKKVELSHVSFIDAYIPSTGIIIEQKSFDVNLDSSAKQSDGTMATPFEQAKRYYDWLPKSQKGRYIIVCNFRELRIHDMEAPKAPPEIIAIKDLKREHHKLSFIVDANAKSPKEIREVEISVKAGELVGKLYDSLIKRYVNPNDKHSQKSLNIFCVRIVFLLYAEDSGLFAKSQFHDYLKARELTARDAVLKLFDVLSQKIHERDPYIEHGLKEFPYVNGGLFEEKDIELPQIDGEPLRIILEEMSEGFDWSDISPTIFGAVFESTLNPQTRHSGGMHYTSIENIHKVINPLFLDSLTEEANEIINSPASSSRTKKLREFQKRISKIIFLDPACGSGNFLTESYLSLRRLENRIISALSTGQITFAFSKEETPVQISISQFYGIEINDFAVSVARTALWIAESQMWNETASIVQLLDDPLPLKSFDHNIIEDNALRLDWNTLIPTEGDLYIMGNPPFLGYSVQNREQKADMMYVFVDENGKPYRTAGKVDYVAGWYFRASELMQKRKLKAAFVSTNSITQGEQISYVFKMMYERFGIIVDFAHQAFVWDSEAQEKAKVHVVVIGLTNRENDDRKMKRLYNSEGVRLVDCINFYLVKGSIVFAEPRQKAVSPDAPPMMTGNRAADGGNLLINSQEEYEEFIRREPKAEKYIKRYMMGYEFINNVKRFCLWLVDVSPQELKSMPRVLERVRACREDRLKGAADRVKLADTPHLFREQLNPKRYLAIPKTSSENRFYIPIGWLDDSVVPGDALRIIPDATLYHFGILTSRIHMAWMRRVSGRLKSDYSYSNTIVYNTFAWPSPTPKQKSRIEMTAQKILEARSLYPDSSFAALYDDAAMPAELRKAHRENDDAVCEAYGWERNISEEEIVTRLFEMYYALTKED